MQHDAATLVGLFGEFLRRARAVRRLGSAAIDLCYVAAGRFDGFWEQSLNPWDVAAGALIVQEAGGRVTDLARRSVQFACRQPRRHATDTSTTPMVEIIQAFFKVGNRALIGLHLSERL